MSLYSTYKNSGEQFTADGVVSVVVVFVIVVAEDGGDRGVIDTDECLLQGFDHSICFHYILLEFISSGGELK